MKKRAIVVAVVTLSMVLSLLVSACQPASTSTAGQTVVETTATGTEQEGKEVSASQESTGPVTVTFWHAYNANVEGKFLNDTLIPEFEAIHPDIKIQAVSQPYDQFRRQLLIALSGGTAPDLARLDIIWVPELADQGALASLDEVIPDFASYSEQFLPGPLSTSLFNGHYYGLPLDTNTRVLIWNKAMFEAAGIAEPPKTIDEFTADCVKIKSLGTDKYCFADQSTAAWGINPWIWSFGGDLTDPGVTTADSFYNGANTVAAYQYLKDAMDNGYIHPGMTSADVDLWGGLAKDQIAMILEGPWFPLYFGDQFPDKEYGMALMPAGKGGSVSVVGGEDIVLFQQSANKEAALEFMKFMLSEDTQLKLVSVDQMPVLKSAASSDIIKSHPFFGIFLEQLATAKARTPHPQWSKIEEVVKNTGSAILTNEVGVQEGLDNAALEINNLLPLR